MLFRSLNIQCAFTSVFFLLAVPAAEAGLLSAGNLTVAAGSSGTIDVTWSSTQALTMLNTQFILRAVTGVSGGAVFTVDGGGDPAVPPLSDANYVFYGDSFALSLSPFTNPASVSQDTWAGDSYTFADSSFNNLDNIQNGTRLWTTLTITGVVPGTYQLELGSSDYENLSSGGPVSLIATDLTGGLITVTGGAAVPEPSSLLVGASILGLVVRQSRKCRKGRTPAST